MKYINNIENTFIFLGIFYGINNIEQLLGIILLILNIFLILFKTIYKIILKIKNKQYNIEKDIENAIDEIEKLKGEENASNK
ncbi:hypothetical protein [Romboutsia ilealis]|uniref:hypothetical protein n=1 Tax=Romboutsia ilealis TaxID=1115758 RepID=UPI00257099E2|nr:hypothetical protein [Romboutsia ilealis]